MSGDLRAGETARTRSRVLGDTTGGDRPTRAGALVTVCDVTRNARALVETLPDPANGEPGGRRLWVYTDNLERAEAGQLFAMEA